MRVLFKISGGLASFPGLQKEQVVDTDQLAPAHAAELEALVAAANLFDGAASTPARMLPDARSYQIVVEQNGESKRAQLRDPLTSEAAALVTALQRAVRSKGAG